MQLACYHSAQLVTCLLLYAGVHQNQLWGDINLINGSPWPYVNMAAGWNRFRFLNASPSRPRILMVCAALAATIRAQDAGCAVLYCMPVLLSKSCQWCSAANPRALLPAGP
jgi:hypothetical protein